MSAPQDASIIGTTAIDPVARVSPHDKLKALREGCPVFRDEWAKTWLLTRYEDVRATVNDRSLWRHSDHAEEGALGRRNREDRDQEGRVDSILSLDEPDHSRVRLPLAKAFYARINGLKPQIEAIIDGVINTAPDEPFDLMNTIAIPVPILVIARILGVDEDRVEEFRAWSEASILGLNPVRTPEQTELMEWGSGQLQVYFTELMAARRTQPKDDLISDMVALQAAGAPIADEEVRVNLSALLIGGNLTTTDLIGNGMWLMLRHPEELAKLKADPGLAAGAVEEILRYESPVAITSRVASAERQVGGCPVHPRQAMMVSLHAANRDPEVFDAPDRFDITRKHAPHVAFGGGSHICIGAPLARIEAKHAFVKLFQRYPNLSLPEQEIVWRTLPFFRGIETLVVAP
jgi:cytochrome P450